MTPTSTVAQPIMPAGTDAGQPTPSTTDQPDRSAALAPAIPAQAYASTVAQAPGANTKTTGSDANVVQQPATPGAAQPSSAPAQASSALAPMPPRAVKSSAFSKVLSVLGSIAGLAPYALQFTAMAVVGIQHLMAGASGQAKKDAVIEIAAPVLGAVGAFAPGAAGAIANGAGSIESTVQGVFDLIKLLHPAALQVHPDNAGQPTQ